MVVSASFGRVHLCCFWGKIVDGAEGRENSQDLHNCSTISHLNIECLQFGSIFPENHFKARSGGVSGGFFHFLHGIVRFWIGQ
jgi:hypothetical protein